MRYDEWLDLVWGVPRYGSSQQRQPAMRAAEAKRERKTAKCRRDAERTRMGHRQARESVELVPALRRLSRCYQQIVSKAIP